MVKLFKASVSRKHLSVMAGSVGIDNLLKLKMGCVILVFSWNKWWENEKCGKMYVGLYFKQVQQLENEHLPKYSQIKVRNNDFCLASGVVQPFFCCLNTFT